jgi:hypothetical protein
VFPVDWRGFPVLVSRSVAGSCRARGTTSAYTVFRRGEQNLLVAWIVRGDGLRDPLCAGVDAEQGASAERSRVFLQALDVESVDCESG